MKHLTFTKEPRRKSYRVESASHNLDIPATSRINAARAFVGHINDLHGGTALLGSVIFVRELPKGKKTVLLTANVLEDDDKPKPVITLCP
jgi:hypothetical protein